MLVCGKVSVPKQGYIRVTYLIAQVIKVTVGCESHVRVAPLIILSTDFDGITNPLPLHVPLPMTKALLQALYKY